MQTPNSAATILNDHEHTATKQASMIKVWDPLVRVFHWVLVSAFFAAYLTEDDFLTLHSWAGYVVGGAVLLRLIWGFIGTHHARFSDFVTSPKVAWQYAKDSVRFRAKRHIGHNPAGGLMIVIMMISLVLAIVSGMALYGAAEQAGPMASWFNSSSELLQDFLEELHEFFANFTLLLVIVHVGGVLFESLAHRENLVASMINGFKRAAK